MRLSKLLSSNGDASVMVLSIVILIAALLAAAGTIIRWHAHSSERFIEQIESTQLARKGVAEAIGRLMEDDDPAVDWLGETWNQGLSYEDLIVTIEDEGSKLGINWIDKSFWQVLFGYNLNEYKEFIEKTVSKGVLWNNVFEFLNDYPTLEPYKDNFTIYSPFNFNSINEDVLIRLCLAAGADNYQSQMIVREILEFRSYTPFDHGKDLEKILSLRTDLKDVLYPWVISEGPININTASDDVINILAQAGGLSLDFAERVIHERKSSPIRDLEEILRFVSESDKDKLAWLNSWLTVKTSFFRITSKVESTGTRIDVVVKRECLPKENSWTVSIYSWIEGGDGG